MIVPSGESGTKSSFDKNSLSPLRGQRSPKCASKFASRLSSCSLPGKPDDNEQTPKKENTSSSCIRVALVTDIGRDIDDSLALLCLLGAQKFGQAQLVGVVTTGGLTATRARAVRGYLLGANLVEKVPIAIGPYETKQPPSCYIPREFPAPDDADVEKEDGAGLLLRLAETYRSELVIVCIGPLDPLAGAVQRCPDVIRQVGAVYIQGQVHVVPSAGGVAPPMMEPDLAAFNLRESPEAAAIALALQDTVPMRFVGKFAAYRVTLMHKDLQAMQDCTGLPLLSMLEHTMNTFRQGNPELFYQLYPVPVQYRNDQEWFVHMPHLSHPYDPLCVILLLQPQLLDVEVVYGRPNSSGRPVEHWLCGVRKDSHGVPSDQAVIFELHRLIGQVGRLKNERRHSISDMNICRFAQFDPTMMVPYMGEQRPLPANNLHGKPDFLVRGNSGVTEGKSIVSSTSRAASLETLGTDVLCSRESSKEIEPMEKPVLYNNLLSVESPTAPASASPARLRLPRLWTTRHGAANSCGCVVA